MNRRAFVFASLAAATAVSGAAQAAPDIKVIYVGGLDCEPCTRWKHTYLQGWMASPEFRQVTWVEVESPKLKDAYQRRFWSGELGAVLDQLPRKTVVVANQAGVNKWTTLMSDLRKILGENHGG